MIGFKQRMRLQTREMNIKWGEIVKNLGTTIEDLVALSILGIIGEEFSIENRVSWNKNGKNTSGWQRKRI